MFLCQNAFLFLKVGVMLLFVFRLPSKIHIAKRTADVFKNNGSRVDDAGSVCIRFFQKLFGLWLWKNPIGVSTHAHPFVSDYVGFCA